MDATPLLTRNGHTPTPLDGEFELSELLDMLAAELDRMNAAQRVNIELELGVRRDSEGRFLFHSSALGVLKVGLEPVPQLDGDYTDIATLAHITQREERALSRVGIYSVEDLVRSTQSAATLARLSRRARIPETRLRAWRGLPFMTSVNPSSGPPGSTVVIDGGNFGHVPDSSANVSFKGTPATVTTWSDTRLVVTLPRVSGAGALRVAIGDVVTNALPWESITDDVFVRDIIFAPPHPMVGDTVMLNADVFNRGTGASTAFPVQWTIDRAPQPSLLHGILQPDEQSRDASTRLELTPSAGTHTIRFTADPAGTLLRSDPPARTFVREFTVRRLSS